MKKIEIIIILFSLLIGVSACKKKKEEMKGPFPPDYFRNEIARMQKTDVLTEVNAAFAKYNYRFFQVGGKEKEIPGVQWTDEMGTRYGVQVINGTGDETYGKDHREYKKLARDFAEKYNKLLWAKIQEMEKKKPETEAVDGV